MTTCSRVSIVLAASAAAGWISGPSYAQEPEQSAQGAAELGEIVVTAQRRAENLQDTPIAITAISADSVSRQQITDVSDLNGAVPGLVIGGNGGLGGNNPFSLRGVTAQVLPIGAAPSAVGVYLDGVYLSRPDAAFFALADVERIEVLRGPQGTLYGRNTAGGAINIITRTPSDRFSAVGDISYGNYDQIDAKGYIAGPIGGGFSASISAGYTERDGYYRNSITGNRLGAVDSITARGKLRYENEADTFRFQLSYDRTRRNSEDIFYNLRAFPTTAPRSLRNPVVVSTDLEPYIGTRQTSQGAAVIIEGEIDDNLTLTSIGSWRDFKSKTIYDLDMMDLAAPVLHTFAVTTSETMSNETRIAYLNDNVKITLGVNYYYEDGTNFVEIATAKNIDTPPVFRRFVTNTTSVEAYAGFGQAELSISDWLELILGARYQHESRRFTQENLPPNVVNRDRTSDNAFLPKAGVNIKPHANTLIYASVSKGYQGPGFNFAPNLARPVGFINGFGPETLWAYEVGAKLDMFDRRLRFNAAAFLYDYKDLQVRQTFPVPGSTVPLAQITNAGRARIKGVEVESTFAVTPWLTLHGSLSYLDGRYRELCETGGIPVLDPPCLANGSPGFDRVGNRLQQAPKWQWSLAASATYPITDRMGLNANASYFRQSRSYFTAANDEVLGNSGYSRIDARLGLELDGRYEIYIFGRNLSDKRVPLATLFVSPTITAGSLNDPRTYGMGARVSF